MNKKSDKKLPSLKEAYKVNQKAFRLIYKKYPQMFTSRIVNIIWNAFTPYIGIYLSALIIDELSEGRDPKKLTILILTALISAALISLASALLAKWRDTQCAGMYFKVKQIFTEKLLDMDFVNIDNTKTHEMLSTIQQNQNGGGWGLLKIIGNYESLFSSVFTLFGGCTLTITLFINKVPENAGTLTILNSPLFIIAIIIIMLAVTYISPALSNKAGSYYANGAESHNLGNRLFGFFGFLGYCQEYAADVRMYRQDKICDKYNASKTTVFGSNGLFAKYARGPMGFYYAASAASNVIFTGFVYIFICLKARAGAFGVGSVTQYIASVTKLSDGISSLIGTVGNMRNNAPFLKLIFDFLEIPNTMQRGSLPVRISSHGKYNIEFRNVSFKYPGSESYALKNINVKFDAGERIAVVGQNGSGKTTFIKLLCRLYDPTEGTIMLNGTDIKEYNYSEYLNIFSVVFQDFKLFAFTLGQNVGTSVNYNKITAESCLRKADFGDRLDTLNDGLNTYLYKEFSKNGVDISGGEAQKIAIARSLYKNAPIIILDEPTAALDPIAESEVYTNFNDIVENKTAIYISHRLSSCRFCRDILVFNEGNLVQQGSHEDLLSDQNNKYYELWNAQAQYYLS